MKPTLEDYIFDMETRPPDHGTPNDQDLWAQLQKKESDLLLAAELGKALLEKNEELAKQQEKLIEEYSKKLEVSEPNMWFFFGFSLLWCVLFRFGFLFHLPENSILIFHSVGLTHSSVFLFVYKQCNW